MQKFQTSMCIALLVGLTCSMSVVGAEELVVENPNDIQLSDQHIEMMLDAVKAYVYKRPPAADTMKIYNPVNSEEMTLRHIRTLPTGDCLRNLGGGWLLICAQFYDAAISPRDYEKDPSAVDIYDVGFVIESITEVESTELEGSELDIRIPKKMMIRKAAILGINGEAIREYVKGPDGAWETRLVEDAGQSAE